MSINAQNLVFVVSDKQARRKQLQIGGGGGGGGHGCENGRRGVTSVEII